MWTSICYRQVELLQFLLPHKWSKWNKSYKGLRRWLLTSGGFSSPSSPSLGANPFLIFETFLILFCFVLLILPKNILFRPKKFHFKKWTFSLQPASMSYWSNWHGRRSNVLLHRHCAKLGFCSMGTPQPVLHHFYFFKFIFNFFLVPHYFYF